MSVLHFHLCFVENTVAAITPAKLLISHIIRPPDIHVGGLIFCYGFFFFFLLSFFFFRPLISELAEWNSTTSGHMAGSKCSLKMHVRNLGYSFPLQIRGTKTTFFEDFAT